MTIKAKQKSLLLDIRHSIIVMHGRSDW